MTSCTIDIDIDPSTDLPRGIHMTVLTGVKGAGGKAPKREKAFEDGIEHVAFHFEYTIDAKKDVARFDIPREATKLMR